MFRRYPDGRDIPPHCHRKGPAASRRSTVSPRERISPAGATFLSILANPSGWTGGRGEAFAASPRLKASGAGFSKRSSSGDPGCRARPQFLDSRSGDFGSCTARVMGVGPGLNTGSPSKKSMEAG